MVRIGGEGSNIDSDFAEAYAKISGKGKSPQEQIENIRNSVDNKLIVSREEQIEGRRQLTGIDKGLADLKTLSDDVATGVGDALFGEATSENELADDPLRFIGRNLFNLPGGAVTMIPRTVSRLGGAATGTDYTYYDPDTATVPDDQFGQLNALGRGAQVGAAATELLMGGKGLGVVGRGGQALTKGAAGAIAGKATGKGALATGAKAAKGGFTGKKGIDEVVPRSTAREAFENFAGKNVGTRALATGLEEGIQEVTEETFEWLSRTDDSILDGGPSDEEWGELGSSAIQGFAGGFIGGGAFGTIGGLATMNKDKRLAAAESGSDSNSQDDPSSSSYVPAGYQYIPDVAINDATKQDRPDPSMSGMSGTVHADPKYGVNSFGMGEDDLFAMYRRPEGEAEINELVGEENIEWVARAIFDGDNYIGRDGVSRGKRVARDDLTKLLKSLPENRKLAFKYPATGRQMLLSFIAIEPGSGVWTNPDIAGVFNGDFDTDPLNIEMAYKAIANGEDIVKLRPSQQFASNAVPGKSLLDPEYVTFSKISAKEVSNILAVFADEDVDAKQFLKDYNNAKPEDRLAIVSTFLSNEGMNLSNTAIDMLWTAARKVSRTLSREAAINKVDNANHVINELMTKSKNAGRDFLGTVNEDATIVTAKIQLGQLDPLNEGNLVRIATSEIVQSRASNDLYDKDVIQDITTDVLTQVVNNTIGVIASASTPLNVLVGTFNAFVRSEVRAALRGKLIKTPEDMQVVIDIVNNLRKSFEESEYYKTVMRYNNEIVGTSQLYPGFVGFTDEIKGMNGVMVEFERSFGEEQASEFFDVPDRIKDAQYTVSQMFKEIQNSVDNITDAFVNYGENQDAFIEAATHSAGKTARRIGEKAEQNVREVMSGDGHLEIVDGFVVQRDMGPAISRLTMLKYMLRESLKVINLTNIESLMKFSKEAYEAFIGDSVERFLGLVYSFKFMANTSRLSIAMDTYSKTKDVRNYKRMMWEANELTVSGNPLYRTVAAEIRTTKLGEDISMDLYKKLSTLYYEKAPDLSVLEKYFGNLYELGSFGQSLGSIAADIMNVTDDSIFLSQLSLDFEIAGRYAKQASQVSEQTSAREWKDAMAVEGLINRNTPQQIVADMKWVAYLPVKVDEMLLAERSREASHITNASKEKADDNTFAVALAEGLMKISYGGRQNANNQMFDAAGGQSTAEEFMVSRTDLRDIIFTEDPNTTVYLKDNYGKNRKAVNKIDFFREMTGLPWDKEGDYSLQILNLFNTRPKIATQLGAQRLTVSITGNTTLSKDSKLKEEIKKKYRESPQLLRQNKTIEEIKVFMAMDQRYTRIIQDVMSELYEGEALPYSNAEKYDRLYAQAYNKVAIDTYHNLAIMSSGVSAEVASVSARADQYERFLLDIRTILYNNLYKSGTKQFNIPDQVVKESLKRNQISSEAVRTIFGTNSWLVSESFTGGISAEVGGITLSGEERSFLERIDTSIEYIQTIGAINAPAPEWVDVVESFKYRLPDKEENPIEYAALTEEAAKDSRFVDADGVVDAEGYKQSLIEDFAKRYEEDIHNGIVADKDMYAKAVNSFLFLMPEDFNAMARDGEALTRLKNTGVMVNYGGKNDISAYVLVDSMVQRRDDLLADREQRLARIDRKRDRNIERYNSNRNTTAQAKAAIESENLRWLQSANAIEKNFNAAISEEITGVWEDLRIAISYAELTNQLKKNNLPGDPIHINALSELERIHSDYINILNEYRETVPSGTVFDRLVWENREESKVFRLPKVNVFDPATSRISDNINMAMKGGTTPGGVSDGAQGTGWMSFFGQLGKRAKCSHEGTPMTLEEAISDRDVSVIKVGRKIYRISSINAMAKLNAIYDESPDAPVIAFRMQDCRCPGCCTTHTKRHRDNWSVDDNRLSTFCYNLSVFMQETSNMLQKKKLRPSDLARMFADKAASKEALMTKYVSLKEMDADIFVKTVNNFRLEWRRSLASFIQEELNADADTAQDRLLDPSFSEDVSDFITRFASIRVVLPDGSKFEEYAHVADAFGRMTELAEELAAAGIEAEVEGSPMMISLEDSAYAGRRYMNANKDKSSKVRLGMEGLQDPGHRIRISEEGLSYTQTETFAPGKLDLVEQYGMMAPSKYDVTTLPPGVDQHAYLDYIERLIGKPNIRRKGNRRNYYAKGVETLTSDSAELMRKAVGNVVGINSDTFILVGKEESELLQDSQYLRNLANPKKEGGHSFKWGHRFLDDMPRFMLREGETPCVILDDTKDGSLYSEYADWLNYTYSDQEALIFVAKGQRVPTNAIRTNSYSSEKYDTYIVYPNPSNDIPGNGYSLGPMDIQDQWYMVVGGDVGDAESVFPTSFDGKEYTSRRTADFNIKNLLKNKIGTVTFVGNDEQAEVYAAFQNSIGERDPKLPQVDLSDHNFTQKSLEIAFENYDKASLSPQGLRMQSSVGDIITIVKIPGDQVVYKPIFLEDLPGLRGKTDEIYRTKNPLGSGFLFYATYTGTFEPGVYKKHSGDGSGYKTTGTVAYSLDDTPVMANGQSAIVIRETDLIKKTRDAAETEDMKLSVAYQLARIDGTYRNMLGEYSQDQKIYVPKSTLPLAIKSSPMLKNALGNPNNIDIFEMILQYGYKSKEFQNPEGERVVMKFINNVLASNGISPGRYTIIGMNEDGKATFRQMRDRSISMVFQNFTRNEKLIFYNYITDGELCPFGVNGDFNNSMMLNGDLEARTNTGEYVYWHYSDGNFNFENSSDVDLPSLNGITIGLSQSALSSAYSAPAILDYPNLVAKQNLDAGELGSMFEADVERILEQIDKNMEGNVEYESEVEELFDHAIASQAAGLAAGVSPWVGMRDNIRNARMAWRRPVKIYILDENENKSFLKDDKDKMERINGDEIEAIELRFWQITGQDRAGEKKFNFFTIRQVLSRWITYSDIPGKPFSASYDMIMTVLDNMEKCYQPDREGIYPRMEYMFKSGKPAEWRYGMMGDPVMTDIEWSFPAVRDLFSSKEEFINAGASFQQKQIDGILDVVGPPQKKKALEGMHMYLEHAWSKAQPGLDVGHVSFVDPNKTAEKHQQEIIKSLGIDTEQAAIATILSNATKKDNERLLYIREREKSGFRTRLNKRKKDDADNPKPVKESKKTGKSFVSWALDRMLKLRIGNSLVLRIPVAVGAATRTVVAGSAARAAGRIRWALGERGVTDQGALPSDYSYITTMASDPLLRQFSKDFQMVNAWGEPATILNGYFSDTDRTRKKLSELVKEDKLAGYQRLGGEFAAGGGIGQEFVVSDWLLRMCMLTGDVKYLSKLVGEEISAPVMTGAEWDLLLNDRQKLYEWLADAMQPDSPYQKIMIAAMQDSSRITQSRKNGAYQIFRALVRYIGGENADKAFSVFVYPFANYAINITAWASNMIYAFPSETLFYCLHKNGRKLQLYLQANGVENELIDSIDWAELDSGRSFKEALLRDAVRYGGMQLLAAAFAGLIDFGDPEGDDLKDEWTEYTIFGMRIDALWPLSDIIGPVGPLIVYWHTVRSGNPRPNLLWNGFYDTVQNGAITKASSVLNALEDPLAWLDDISDADMAYLNGANAEEYDPEQAALNGWFLQGIGSLYTIGAPAFIDDFIKIFQADTTAPSSNYIYEEDDSGKPTGRINPDTGQAYLERADYDDIQWRRLTRYRPLLGAIKDLASGAGWAGDKTGYMGAEMPDIVRYEPYQVASAKIYEVNGNEAHDSEVAADVIYMLGSYDDMEELIATGFYINADTRYYVGQKIWDIYWSYQYQINEAKRLGLNDYEALGNGDYITGQKIWLTWLDEMETQKQFYRDLYEKKLDSEPLRQRMLTANMLQQSYRTDASGESYGTGYPNSNPLSLLAVGSQNNAGLEGGFSSMSPLTDLPVGERGWRWNTANTYYDTTPFESYADDENGEGFSAVFSQQVALDNIVTLEDAYNPSYASTSSNGYTYSRKSGGGGGGGYSSMPKIYSNPQDIQGDYATIMRPDRLSDSSLDYIRPDWETKGSRDASRRSDI